MQGNRYSNSRYGGHPYQKREQQYDNYDKNQSRRDYSQCRRNGNNSHSTNASYREYQYDNDSGTYGEKKAEKSYSDRRVWKRQEYQSDTSNILYEKNSRYRTQFNENGSTNYANRNLFEKANSDANYKKPVVYADRFSSGNRNTGVELQSGTLGNASHNSYQSSHHWRDSNVYSKPNTNNGLSNYNFLTDSGSMLTQERNQPVHQETLLTIFPNSRLRAVNAHTWKKNNISDNAKDLQGYSNLSLSDQAVSQHCTVNYQEKSFYNKESMKVNHAPFKKGLSKQQRCLRIQKKQKASLLTETENRLNVKVLNGARLSSEDGREFLKLVQEATKVSIKLNKIGKGFTYAVNGSNESKARARRAIERYCFPTQVKPHDLLSMFNLWEFNFKALLEVLWNLDTPYDWSKTASRLYEKIQKLTKKLAVREIKQPTGLSRYIKKRYTVLNAMILGKLKLREASEHMQVIRRWAKEGNRSEIDATVKQAFNYIFKSSEPLDIDYPSVISQLPVDEKIPLRYEIQNLLQSGVTLCEKLVWTEELKKLKGLYAEVILHDYSSDTVDKFKLHLATLQQLCCAHQMAV